MYPQEDEESVRISVRYQVWRFSVNWTEFLLTLDWLYKDGGQSPRWGLTGKRAQRSLTKLGQRKKKKSSSYANCPQCIWNYLRASFKFRLSELLHNWQGFPMTVWLTDINLWNLEQFWLRQMPWIWVWVELHSCPWNFTQVSTIKENILVLISIPEP